jgi:hypothetical protein
MTTQNELIERLVEMSDEEVKGQLLDAFTLVGTMVCSNPEQTAKLLVTLLNPTPTQEQAEMMVELFVRILRLLHAATADGKVIKIIGSVGTEAMH